MTATSSQLWTGSQRLHVGPPARRDHLRSALVWLDLACLATAFAAAMLAEGVRTEAVRLEEFLSMRMGVANFGIFLGLVVSWHLCLRSAGLYDASRPLLGRGRAAEAARGVAFATLLVALAAVLFRVSAATPTFLVGFWIMGSALVLGARELVAAGLAAAGRGARLERHVLVAGTGQRALSLAREIESDPDTRARVVGFVDDEWAGTEAFRASGGRLVADLKNLGAYLRDHVVDEIVIALPLSLLLRYRTRILAVCAEQGVTVRFPVSLVTDLPPHPRRRRDDVLLTVSHVALGGWQLAAKRSLDVVLAGLGLLTSAPLFGLIALAIRLDSPGPVFFAQERVGLNKRRFNMHKFRTMVVDAESRIREVEHLNHMQGPTFKLKDDPRVTRIGRFLRRSSIDELPQLWNVLKGEMSLVGPRPLPLRDVDGFEDDRHRRRFSVRPGLTGLWQVSGRNELSFETWMELDLRYIDGWSLGFDLKILMRTLPAVLSGRGAE
jgi:exopolysaccharide biosynthesis polyprenyl glycosylphosphotransferase